VQNPKSCRDHALKCSRLAESFPEGSGRQLFAEMAATWTRRAIAAEKSAPAPGQWVALRGNEIYRFGSRVDANDHRRR
jgi:hypothetical protein